MFNLPSLIVVQYDLSTSDSYNFNGSADLPIGYFDGFIASITTAAYTQSTSISPTVANSSSRWSWGGVGWNDGQLDTKKGTITLSVPQDGQAHYLNLALDTRTNADQLYPSWGTFKVATVDLDIDSDNNNGLNPPARTTSEDAVEDKTGDDSKPGKVILIDDYDSDGDGIPDYADGFDGDSVITGDETSAGSKFVPVVLDLGMTNVSTAKISIQYSDSDPSQVSATLDNPFQLPGYGSLRLWTKDGSQSRNKASIASGGDYIPAGEFTAQQLGLSQGQPLTLYVESVQRSVAVADLPITISVDPSGARVFAASDRVRVTATQAEVWARNYGDSDAQMFITDRLIMSDLSNDPTYNDGFTPGAFQSYKIKVYDPRTTGFSQFFVNGQAVSMSHVSDHWETSEFIGVESGTNASWSVPYQKINLSNETTQLSYNPMWPFSSGPKIKSPGEAVERLGKSVQDKVQEMHSQSWTPTIPTDDGAFGKEVHTRVSAQLTAEDSHWVSDVYVRRSDNHIISIGAPPPGGVTGTTQVDLIYLKQGQQLQVGQVWDREQYSLMAEVKTSIGGKIDPDQLGRLKALNGGEDIFVTEGTEVMYKRSGGWQINTKWKQIGRFLSLVGAAKTAWNIMHADSYDAEMDAIITKANYIQKRPYVPGPIGETEKVGDLVQLQSMFGDYLSHFVPSDTAVNAMKLFSLNKIISEMGTDE
ncbi:MAG TPA: hypothetical protein VHD56_01105 [Tepidisphaeraceae bacterium]|nr:hypothetical protein [Tepidisphaeraceae bacterium]